MSAPPAGDHPVPVGHRTQLSDPGSPAGRLLPIAHGSFGKGFGVRPSLSCFLPATRKKLFELARAFSEKTKMRKSKRKHLLKHQVYPKRGWGAAGGAGLWKQHCLVSPRLWSGWSLLVASCGCAVGCEGRLWYHSHVLAPQLVFLSGGRRLGTAASTANLLDDVEGHSCGKKRRTVLCPVRCAQHGYLGSRSARPCPAPRHRPAGVGSHWDHAGVWPPVQRAHPWSRVAPL